MDQDDIHVELHGYKEVTDRFIQAVRWCPVEHPNYWELMVPGHGGPVTLDGFTCTRTEIQELVDHLARLFNQSYQANDAEEAEEEE